MFQNTKIKYSIFIFLLIIAIPILIIKLSGVKNWGNNFATVYSSTPNSEMLRTNSAVLAMVPDASGGVYIGGFFTVIGSYTGSGVPVASNTGVPVSTFPKVNSVVHKVIQDGTGGWYIGGDFTQVGTTARNYLAHILPDGTVDQDFDTNVNNSVRALVLSEDGNTLYMGGLFTTINGGTTRNRVAAVNTSDGLVTAFNPGANGTVYSLVLSTSTNTLYLGGTFTTTGTSTIVARDNIAAVDSSTGSTTAFNPNFGVGSIVFTLALSTSSDILYMGGQFTTVGITTRNNIAAVNTSDGSVVGTFDPNADSLILAITLSPDGNALYFGGYFTTINGGTPRNRIAAVNTSDGLVTAFDADASDTVSTLTLSSGGGTLYFGGVFTTVNGGIIRNRIAAVDASTGLVTTFSPNADDYVYTLALSSDGNVLYVGGEFDIFNGTGRNRIAHILSDGTVDPDFNPNADSIVYALALSPDGNTLYLGGLFNTINGGTTRNYAAAVNTSDGLVTSFNPNAGGDVYSLALSTSSDILYMGGSFTTIGGTGRNRIASVSATSGVVTSFNPNASSIVSALDISSDGNTLYMGGYFTTVGGTGRNRIASVNATSGALTSFNPNANNILNTLTLSSDGNTFYIGGNFTTIGGIAHNFIAAVNATSGVATSFNPSVTGGPVQTLALSTDGNTLYMGGDFTTINGTTTNRIGIVNTLDGSVVGGFNPNMNSTVNSIALSSNGNILYLGGNFTTIGGVSHPFFASFSAVIASGGRRRIPTEEATTTPAVGGDTVGATTTPITTTTIITTTTPTITTPSFTFTRVLRFGSIGEEVKQLQIFLNAHGFLVAKIGNGAPGLETRYFGPRTERAVIRFQEAYTKDILIPQGIKEGTGIFLNYSMGVANEILSGERN